MMIQPRKPQTAKQLRAALHCSVDEIDPMDLPSYLKVLQALDDGRLVHPGACSFMMDLGQYEAVPMPMDIWTKIARMPLEMLGLRRSVCSNLKKEGVESVGDLLLYTLDELAWLGVEREDVDDVRRCLEANRLRLPTIEELQEARNRQFWVALPDVTTDVHREIRVARDLLPFVPLERVYQLHTPVFDFLKMKGMRTIGDLMRQSEGDLYQLLRQFVLMQHGLERLEDAPKEHAESLHLSIEHEALLLFNWLGAAEISLSQ